jgi:hypothetical protein
MMKRMLPRLAVALVVASAFACSSSSSPSSQGGAGLLAEETIGAAGGQVTTSDGDLSIVVPAGALAKDTVITVEEVPAPASGAIGKTYEIGPTGTQFLAPVTLSLRYAQADLQGNVAASLEVATIVSGAWAELADEHVDTSGEVVSASTMHLSPYAIVAAKPQKGGDDAAAAADATGADATAGDDAGAGNDAGASDAASDAGASDAASDAGASDAASDAGIGDASDGGSCSPEVSAVGSCLNHPPFCTTYPGTTAGTCTTNDGGQGYVVMCCTNGGG